MTFDTWWKEHGSLHTTIFALAFEQRENYRIVAEAAWNESERNTIDEDGNLEKQINKLEEEISTLKEMLEHANKDAEDARNDIETLKDSIRSCL